MTEQQWLVSVDPVAMLQGLGVPGRHISEAQKVGDRQLRLFGFALWEAWARRGSEPRLFNQVARDLAWIDDPHPGLSHWNLHIQPPPEFAIGAVRNYTKAGIVPVGVMTPGTLKCNRQRLPLEYAADLLRDIVGNPFRPVPSPMPPHAAVLSCPWGMAFAMAEAAYDLRDSNGTLDNHRLLVLADALEEAGCPLEVECLCETAEVVQPRGPGGQMIMHWCKECRNTERKPHPLLAHLRSPGPHVRGCWAVDLLRGVVGDKLSILPDAGGIE